LVTRRLSDFAFALAAMRDTTIIGIGQLAGLHGPFAFPIRIGDEFCGLEFFIPEYLPT
jgi:hypothetical protein